MRGTTARTEGNSPYGEVSRLQRRICSHAVIVSLILACLFSATNQGAVAKGLLFGTFFSIVNFVLLGVAIPITLRETRFRASLISLISLLLRYALLSVPMVVGLKSAAFNFVAVVAGIFSIQIVTMVEYLLIRPIQDGSRAGEG